MKGFGPPRCPFWRSGPSARLRGVCDKQLSHIEFSEEFLVVRSLALVD
jgi:hypothetical protein